MSKDQVITMFYELKDANTGEILESNMQEGGQISFITGHGHIIEKLEEEVSKLKSGDKATKMPSSHFQKNNLLV